MRTHTPTEARVLLEGKEFSSRGAVGVFWEPRGGAIGGLKGYNWKFLGASRRQGVLLEISGSGGYSWTFLGASKGVQVNF